MEEATNFEQQAQAADALQRAKYLSRINKIKQIYSEQLPFPQKYNSNISSNRQQHQRVKYLTQSKPLEKQLLNPSGLYQPQIQFIAMRTEESIIPLSRNLIGPGFRLKDQVMAAPYGSTYNKPRNCSTSIDKVFHTEQYEMKEESKVIEKRIQIGRQIPVGSFRDNISPDESRIPKPQRTQISRNYNKVQTLKINEKPIETKKNTTLQFSHTFTDSSLMDELTIIPQIDSHEISVFPLDNPPSYYYKSIIEKNSNHRQDNLKPEKDFNSKFDMNKTCGGEMQKTVRNKANTIDLSKKNEVENCQYQHQRNRSKSHFEYDKNRDQEDEVLKAKKIDQMQDINQTLQDKERIYEKRVVLVRDKRAISSEEFKRAQKKHEKGRFENQTLRGEQETKGDSHGELKENLKLNKDLKIQQKNSKEITILKEKTQQSYQQYQSFGSTISNTECSLDEIKIQQDFGLQSMVRDYCKQSRESKNIHDNMNILEVKQQKQNQQHQQQLLHNSKPIKQNQNNRGKAQGEKGQENQRIQQIALKQKLLEEHHQQLQQQQEKEQLSQQSQLQRQKSQESVVSQPKRHTSLEKRYALLMSRLDIDRTLKKVRRAVFLTQQKNGLKQVRFLEKDSLEEAVP